MRSISARSARSAQRRARRARFSAAVMCSACIACSVAPSHTPLGGNYEMPAVAAVAERRAAKPSEPTVSASAGEVAPEPTPVKATVKPAPVVEKAPAASDTIVYQPLKAGDQIQADVELGFGAELQGGPQGPPPTKILMDSKMRVVLKIKKASAQALDELELTVTTLSMHSEFAGNSTDGKAEPPEVYDVTLGQSPSIRARNGSQPDAEDRATLLVLVAPMAEFHSHWGRSPGLDLKAGGSWKVPVSVPAFAGDRKETVQVGPFSARYTGRDSASDSVPFDVNLPVEYGTQMGKLNFDLAGKASLSKASGRPVALELSGPFDARGQVAASITGRIKFSAKLSYP